MAVLPRTLALSHRPVIFSAFSTVIAAQSTRHGGVSSEPFASLNLGLSSGDERENVLENRRRFFNGLGIGPDEVALGFQVHGDRSLRAEQPGNYDRYDAFMTNRKNVFVAVSIADCTPVLIYDAENEAVAAIHAGWKGTMQRIVAKTLQAMQTDFGTQPQHCFASVGTCISECSFEVNADVSEHFENRFKRFDAARNKFFVDLKRANTTQLSDFGIPVSQIEISPFCTVIHNADYFSYRREGQRSGRMLAVIGIRG
jgi:polyphenol oxidase